MGWLLHTTAAAYTTYESSVYVSRIASSQCSAAMHVGCLMPMYEQSAKSVARLLLAHLKPLYNTASTCCHTTYACIATSAPSKQPTTQLRLEAQTRHVCCLNLLPHHVHLQVTTSKSSTPYTAAAAIVTIPLGVLKRDASKLFSPPLPADKMGAISRMGMGVLDKVVLTFDKVSFYKGQPPVTVALPTHEHARNSASAAVAMQC